jgi:hypothetical protein
MPTEHNHIPSEVFDWIEHLSFQELNKQQQAKVLQYFSRDVYEELHVAAKEIKKGLQPAIDTKSNLLQAFDKKYPTKGNAIPFPATALWKAAVVILLLGVGMLQFSLLNERSNTGTMVQTIHDTLTVVRQIASAPIVVHDTVAIHVHHQTAHENKAISKHNKAENNLHYPSGVHVLTVNDMEATSNQQRSNSQRQDTLMRQFQYVMM